MTPATVYPELPELVLLPALYFFSLAAVQHPAQVLLTPRFPPRLTPAESLYPEIPLSPSGSYGDSPVLPPCVLSGHFSVPLWSGCVPVLWSFCVPHLPGQIHILCVHLWIPLWKRIAPWAIPHRQSESEDPAELLPSFQSFWKTKFQANRQSNHHRCVLPHTAHTDPLLFPVSDPRNIRYAQIHIKKGTAKFRLSLSWSHIRNMQIPAWNPVCLRSEMPVPGTPVPETRTPAYQTIQRRRYSMHCLQSHLFRYFR